MIRLAILGVSGSIGKQVLNIVKDNPNDFEVVGVSVNKSIDILNDLVKEFPSIKYIGIANNESFEKYQCCKKDTLVFNDLTNLINEDIDMVVNAIVGIAGLIPTFAAINKNKDLALANKESLVCGGEVLQDLLRKSKSKIYPIDSEHSAIAQCLVGENIEDVNRLIITASGGPFRDYSLEDLETVSKEDALNHPNWKMGNKITIDSATLVNKGLEIIEAHYLFNLPYDKIDTVIHYESIVHSMVETKDGSIKAQMGNPSMEIPIQYALYKMKRSFNDNQRFDFTKAFNLHFKPVDLKRFEAIKLAYYVGNKKGSAPLIYNAANEKAVELFLNDAIKFKQIVPLIKDAVDYFENEVVFNLEDILSLDKKVRSYIENKI